jgi:hypothetical protein
MNWANTMQFENYKLLWIKYFVLPLPGYVLLILQAQLGKLGDQLYQEELVALFSLLLLYYFFSPLDSFWDFLWREQNNISLEYTVACKLLYWDYLCIHTEQFHVIHSLLYNRYPTLNDEGSGDVGGHPIVPLHFLSGVRTFLWRTEYW